MTLIDKIKAFFRQLQKKIKHYFSERKEKSRLNKERRLRQKKEKSIRLQEYLRDHRGRRKSIPKDIILRKKITGELYFNNNEDQTYRLVQYDWNGPIIKTITTSTTTGTHKRKGRMGRSLVGFALLGPGGAVIGAAGKRKTKINEVTHSQEIEKEVPSLAILKFQSLQDSEIISKEFVWTSEQDSTIQLFFINLSHK